MGQSPGLYRAASCGPHPAQLWSRKAPRARRLPKASRVLIGAAGRRLRAFAPRHSGGGRPPCQKILSQSLLVAIPCLRPGLREKGRRTDRSGNRRQKTGTLDEADVSLEEFLKDLRACRGASKDVRLGNILLKLRWIARRHLPGTSSLRIGLDSEDLAQEGIVHLLTNIDRFRGDTWSEFFAFAAAIVSQQAAAQARWQRVRKPELRSHEDAHDHARDAKTPSADAEHAEERQRLHSLLAKLSEPYRTPLELRLAGKSNQEIAAILGCKEDLVRKRLSRALAILQGQW